MNRQQIMQRFLDTITRAAVEALDADATLSSKEVAGALLGAAVGALKAEGISTKELLTEIEKSFDGAIDYGRMPKGGPS